MHKLSSSDPPASKVLTASPEQDTEERGGQGEQALHGGSWSLAAHPGPSTGTLRVGCILLAVMRHNASTLGHPFPSTSQSQDRAEAKSLHQIRKEVFQRKQVSFSWSCKTQFLTQMQWLRSSGCFLIPGNLPWSNTITTGEEAGQMQVWQSGLPNANSPFSNISHNVPFNQEGLFPAFNTF